MASTTLKKDTGFTGILCLLLLGLHWPAVLVSPATSTPTSQPPSSNTSDVTNTSATNQSATYITFLSTAITNNTQFIKTTAPSTGSASTTPTQSTMTSGGMNTTITSNSSYVTMIYCPSFMCNYSDCYTMYTIQNATSCSAGDSCQLLRQTDMCYTVSCSASCADSCVNASQTNCSMKCCNYTGCLNGSFASMMMTTTTATTTTTVATTTTPVSMMTTTNSANDGNKCHNGMCTGATCYTAFRDAALQLCTSSQPHCQLKKETVNSKLQWTAGCIANCSGQTTCEAATQPPCHLECCNATTTSCLWLNGTRNVPSFATRGPYLHTELIACLLCLLAFTLMLSD